MALAVAVVGLCIAARWWAGSPPLPPHPSTLGGWQGIAAEAAAQAALPVPPKMFALDGPPTDPRGKNVRLWDAMRLATGADAAHLRQLLGDCVAASACNAIMYRHGVSAALEGRPLDIKPLYPPYLYGAARVNLGMYRFGRGDGCTNTAIAAAAEKYGFVAADTPGLPAYTAAIGRQWGWEGVPAHWLEIGRRQLVRTTARVRSEPQAAQSVCNGYPLTIASPWGGLDKPPVVGGRLLNRRVTTWGHQMAVLAYDDGDGDGRGHYYVLNQWGPDFHGADPAGGPPGGFWVEAADIDWIIRNGEVIAWSDCAGFPAADWEIVMRRLLQTHLANKQDRPRPATMGVAL